MSIRTGAQPKVLAQSVSIEFDLSPILVQQDLSDEGGQQLGLRARVTTPQGCSSNVCLIGCSL